MQYSGILETPGVKDVIVTERKLYVITDRKLPKIYTDRKIIEVKQEQLLYTPHLREILTGTSVKKGKLKEHNKLTPATLYEYSLKNLKGTKKQSVTHAIRGTGGRKSIIKNQGGTIRNSSFTTPPDKTEEAEEFLRLNQVEYNKTNILLTGDDK